MAKICFNPEKKSKHAESIKRLDKITDTWFDNPVIESWTSGNEGSFQRFYENILDLDYDYGRMPTAKEVTRLENETNRYLKNLTKIPSAFGKQFFLPENILSKNPITKKYFDGLVRASNYYRGNQQDIKGDLAAMVTALNKAQGNNSVFSKFGYGRNKAQKEIVALEAKFMDLKKTDPVKARKFYDENLKDVKEGSNLEVTKRFYELIENPDLINNQNLAKSKLRYDGNLIQAAKLWHFGEDSIVPGTKTKVEPLKERLWKILGQGLNKSIKILKNQETDYNTVSKKVSKLEELYNDYFADGAPKKVKNYFPTQVLDIAPTLSRLSQDINKDLTGNSKQKESIDKYLNKMIDDVTKGLEIPGNVYEKSMQRPKEISQDIVGVLDYYANSVIRFNYNTAITEQFVGALKSLNGISNKGDYDKTVRFLSDYIFDMHQSATGKKYTDSKLANIARSITSFNFLSKLGLNVRSVARNATQSLQNWVYFGTEGMYTAMKDLQTPALKKKVDTELSRHGFEFVNIQDIAFPKDMLENTKIDDSGKVIPDISTMGSKFNDYLETVARITGKPMQWVENNVNRGLTFKIAFLTKYQALKDNDVFMKNVLKNNKNENVDAALTRKASNYAADMVKELHYQYDPWAKIKATRSPVGAVLGQFSTYAINFFEYQRKIASKAGNDMLAGEWNSPNTWRLLRLGMLYSVVTGLGAVTNTNFGTLVQNDTAERLKNLDKWIGGTKKEKEEAFFGLDPITSTFGGPFISDIVKLGHIMNFNNMSHDDLSVYFAANKDFNERVKTDKTEELVRMLNGQIARTAFTTFPRMINGTNMGTLLFQELGLYNTPELEGLKKTILKPFQSLPGKAGKAFTPDKKTKQSKNNLQFSEEQINEILQGFN